MINARVTLSSYAVYGPHKCQSSEDPCVIAWHALVPHMIFKIYLTHTLQAPYSVAEIEHALLSHMGFLPF